MIEKNKELDKPESYVDFEQFLNEGDRKYFDAIAQSSTVKQASIRLGVEPQTLYNWKYDLLNRRIPQAIGFLKCVSLEKHRSSMLRRLLTQ